VLPRHNAAGREANHDAGPQYFFKESPFFEIRELLLNNITLEGKDPQLVLVSRH
jgi:hypothetical protein